MTNLVGDISVSVESINLFVIPTSEWILIRALFLLYVYHMTPIHLSTREAVKIENLSYSQNYIDNQQQPAGVAIMTRSKIAFELP